MVALVAAALVVTSGSGRAALGHPVAGIAAIIAASAPRDDIFNG
jgi:2-keto-4-pentenoate hydratase